MRRLFAAGILIAFSCTGPQIPVRPPTNQHEQKPPAVTENQPTTLALLKKLKPRITELVMQLGSPDFKTRENAKKELLEIGLPSVPAIEEAEKSTDPEVAHTAKTLAKTLKPDIKRLIIVRDRWSDPDNILKVRLDRVNLESLPGQANFSQYVKLLRSKAKVSVFIHPDMFSNDPSVEIEKRQYSLPELLEAIAEKLDATWVARFGTLYLANPEKALEVAGAEILTAEGDTGEMFLRSVKTRNITMSITKINSLESVLDFFTEIHKFEYVFNKGVDPKTIIHPFELKDIRFQGVLSLVLISTDLKAHFKGRKLTISRAEFSHISTELREQRKRIGKYRKAWDNLKMSGR